MTTLAAIQAPRRIGPRLPVRLRMARWVLAAAIRVLFDIRISGAENIPDGNYIVLANHLGWIDPLLILTALPAEPRLYFIGAQQAFARKWKVRLMRWFDSMIPFERGARWVGKNVFDKPLKVLENGARLAFFPEGDSFPDEGVLHPLQRGIGHFLMGAPAAYPIIPVALSGTRELYWRKAITITIGKPFRVTTEGLPHHAAIDAVVEQVTGSLRAILPPYREPTVTTKHLRFLTNWLD